MSGPIIECVPNVSEGRHPAIIQKIASAVAAVPGVKLLHLDPGAGANRTVFTFAGPPNAVSEAAFQLFKIAAASIDMRQHQGTHPRMGVVDVCPFVPIANISLAECAAIATTFGQRVWNELGIPVYLYEAAATTNKRKNLARVRKGEYEGLATKMQQAEWQVDFGTNKWNPKTGTAIIGARPFLIAWNINLDTDKLPIAKTIAGQLRESGQLIRQADGNQYRQAGRFAGLKAIGWFIEEYGRCQVSTNVVAPDQVNLLTVYHAGQKLAEALGARVTGSELIGLIPAKYLLQTVSDVPGDEATKMEAAVARLQLADLQAFNWQERVLEAVMERKSND